MWTSVASFAAMSFSHAAAGVCYYPRYVPVAPPRWITARRSSFSGSVKGGDR